MGTGNGVIISIPLTESKSTVPLLASLDYLFGEASGAEPILSPDFLSFHVSLIDSELYLLAVSTAPPAIPASKFPD